MASYKRHIRNVERAVEEIWSDYAISQTAKGHVCVTLRLGSASRKVFTAGTPGDARGLLNFQQDLRRNIEILKAGVEK